MIDYMLDPPDYKDVEICPRCGKEASKNTDDNGFCGFACWHLSNAGEVKKQILHLQKNKKDVLPVLERYWFPFMQLTTVSRYRSLLTEK